MQPTDRKRVGIIGAGRIGQAMAQTALRAGRQAVIANSRGPQSLTSVVEALGEGVSAGTVEDASAADIVVLAVPWPQVSQAVDGLELDGRIVIDPTNDFDPSDLDGRTFLITGANTGIGRATTEALAARGATVYMACRSEAKARPVRDAIATATGNNDLHLLSLDLGDLASVRACADEWGYFCHEGLLDRVRCIVPSTVSGANQFHSMQGSYTLGSGLRSRLLWPLVKLRLPVVQQILAYRRQRIGDRHRRHELVDMP